MQSSSLSSSQNENNDNRSRDTEIQGKNTEDIDVDNTSLANNSSSKNSFDGANDISNSFNDLDWDMRDHPFWLAANEAFKNLPLCAVLCESMQVT